MEAIARYWFEHFHFFMVLCIIRKKDSFCYSLQEDFSSKNKASPLPSHLGLNFFSYWFWCLDACMLFFSFTWGRIEILKGLKYWKIEAQTGWVLQTVAGRGISDPISQVRTQQHNGTGGEVGDHLLLPPCPMVTGNFHGGKSWHQPRAAPWAEEW